jgi:hypothetical protein
MTQLSRDDRNRIAMGLMEYKKSLDLTDSQENDLLEYNRVEISETDELAIRLNLVGDYYELE